MNWVFIFILFKNILTPKWAFLSVSFLLYFFNLVKNNKFFKGEKGRDKDN